MFLETIKIVDGEALHVEYHQRRLERALPNSYKLIEHLKNTPANTTCRCRVIYDEESLHVEYVEYKMKHIKSLHVVSSNIEYEHKYLDRCELNALYELRKNCDDVLIVKDGLIRETTIANIAFFDGNSWFTPKKPLLCGTTRDRYLDNKLVLEKDIYIDELKHFQKCAILNSMMGFYEIESIVLGDSDVVRFS